MPVVTASNGAALHAFIKERIAPGESLYGVVDAARNKPLAFDGPTRFGWKIRWLFDKKTDKQMKDVAPYLVPIPFESRFPYPQSEYLDLWAVHLWSAAGILFTSRAGTEQVWQHLRKIFEMTGEDGREFFFRFYDPRVARTLLPVWTGERVSEYFGPMSQMLVEAEARGCMLTCRPAGDAVESVQTMLTVETG